jgi:hypothetical protein
MRAITTNMDADVKRAEDLLAAPNGGYWSVSLVVRLTTVRDQSVNERHRGQGACGGLRDPVLMDTGLVNVAGEPWKLAAECQGPLVVA